MVRIVVRDGKWLSFPPLPLGSDLGLVRDS